MFESIRSIGYHLEDAIADIIDNSITAHAQNVWIDFHWAGPDSAITITDDGDGMSTRTLIDAMRLGNRHPDEARAEDDLGRYSLGLKTASLSQCRRLTVLTKPSSKKLSSRTWDLDFLRKQNDWVLIKDAAASRVHKSAFESLAHGTCVVWQTMDRVVGNEPEEDPIARDLFLARAKRVEKHVGIVFHRFLETRRLKIHLNRVPVAAIDPYFIRGRSTELEGEVLKAFGKTMPVRAFVLPHHSFLSDAEFDLGRGTKGNWNEHQGFWVYRNERLLVPGSWLNLGLQQEEHYKLARIQIDLPNSMDSAWKIDIKKAKAEAPDSLLPQLRKIAQIARREATAVYRHRGKVARRKHASEISHVWEEAQVRKGRQFRINRKHPLLAQYLAQRGPVALAARDIIDLAEMMLPLETIAYQVAREPEQFATAHDDGLPTAIVAFGLKHYEDLISQGQSPNVAYETLMGMEPFSSSSAFIAQLDKKRGKT